jgi:hypothetical protein
MRINERESRSGIQSLQQDEAIFERSKRTCAYKKPGHGKTNPIPIRSLPNPRPILAQHSAHGFAGKTLFLSENFKTPAPHRPAFNPSFDSGAPKAPLTKAASSGGAGQTFETGAASRSRSQGRISESDW